MSEQRCGTCRWWKPQVSTAEYGRCVAPLPMSIFVSDKVAMNRDQIAITCPCCERKERDDLERHAAE
jgi:hypothetical protein